MTYMLCKFADQTRWTYAIIHKVVFQFFWVIFSAKLQKFHCSVCYLFPLWNVIPATHAAHSQSTNYFPKPVSIVKDGMWAVLILLPLAFFIISAVKWTLFSFDFCNMGNSSKWKYYGCLFVICFLAPRTDLNPSWRQSFTGHLTIPVSSSFSESRRLHFIASETVDQTTRSCSMTTSKQEANSLTDLWKFPWLHIIWPLSTELDQWRSRFCEEVQ